MYEKEPYRDTITAASSVFRTIGREEYGRRFSDASTLTAKQIDVLPALSPDLCRVTRLPRLSATYELTRP